MIRKRGEKTLQCFIRVTKTELVTKREAEEYFVSVVTINSTGCRSDEFMSRGRTACAGFPSNSDILGRNVQYISGSFKDTKQLHCHCVIGMMQQLLYLYCRRNVGTEMMRYSGMMRTERSSGSFFTYQKWLNMRCCEAEERANSGHFWSEILLVLKATQYATEHTYNILPNFNWTATLFATFGTLRRQLPKVMSPKIYKT